MNIYILNLPYEFEAFQLGIELDIINYVPEENFTKVENDTEQMIIYNIEFDDEDMMYKFDKELRTKAPYIFKDKITFNWKKKLVK